MLANKPVKLYKHMDACEGQPSILQHDDDVVRPVLDPRCAAAEGRCVLVGLSTLAGIVVVATGSLTLSSLLLRAASPCSSLAIAGCGRGPDSLRPYLKRRNLWFPVVPCGSRNRLLCYSVKVFRFVRWVLIFRV